MVEATWSNGLTLMIAGMVVVYLLLVVLIFSMKGMSALMGPLSKIIPEPEAEVKKTTKAKPAKSDEDVVAAIAAVKLMKN